MTEDDFLRLTRVSVDSGDLLMVFLRLTGYSFAMIDRSGLKQSGRWQASVREQL